MTQLEKQKEIERLRIILNSYGLFFFRILKG